MSVGMISRSNEKSDQPPDSLIVRIDLFNLILDLARFSIIPVGILYVIIVKSNSDGNLIFALYRHDIPLLIPVFIFSVFLFFYILHVWRLAKYGKNYLTLNKAGIQSSYRQVSIDWESVVSVRLSKLGRRTLVGSDSFVIRCVLPGGRDLDAGQPEEVSYRWRLDGTDANQSRLLNCAKQWHKEAQERAGNAST